MLSEQLRTAREMLKSCKGKEEMLSIICRATHKQADKFTYFNYNIRGHTYRGYIYNPYRMLLQGDLYGTVFCMWDNAPHIIRGYPKIIYAQASYLMNRDVVVEEKVDGTCLVFFNFPNGDLMGKTRATPRYDTTGYLGREWHELAGSTGLLDNIRKLTRDGYNPVLELYGYLNRCEYVDYPDTPIAMKGLDIIDTRTFSFVPYDKKKDLFDDVEIPMPDMILRGKLDDNQLTYLERQAESQMGVYEGFMAKYWSDLYQDQFFGKIKCHAVRELARLRSGGAMPASEIDKAIRKALENVSMISSVSELHSMVLEDLYDENDKSLVDASLVRIERTIAKAFPIDTLEIWEYLDDIDPVLPVIMDNKREVLSMLSSQCSTFKENPKHGYQAFILYMQKKGRL